MNFFNLFDSAAENNIIPQRTSDMVTGSEFIKNNMNLNGPIRQQNILNEFMNGNIPDFLRKFKDITVTGNENSMTYLVMPDVLSIGSNEDYVRIPMNPHTAQAIADKYDFSLPTKKMVNDIWKNSINKLSPLPWGPPYDSSMSSTYRIGVHNSRVQAQLKDKDYTELTSGHKKDVVLTNKLSPNNTNNRVAIYGWIQSNGKPIQALNPISHEDTYEDYSHGIRLIANDVLVNGEFIKLNDVFTNNKLASLVSDEGVLTFIRY